MKAKLLFVALAAFALLHQDSWLWDDAGLVLGFLPSGLAYHAGYSLATAALWAVVSRLAWADSLAASDAVADSAESHPR